jgi:3',5'-cyclic AMP phosphodiesterase CpdA
MPQRITVLHLSDLQFGKNHRFGNTTLPGGDNPYDTVLQRLILDLKGLEKEHGLKPDLMILTGDLAEWGMKSEFDQVLKLIKGLEGALRLTRDRVVVIPGNHDINRKACAAYVYDCEADELSPEKPYWPKWRHYQKFLGELYKDQPERIFTHDRCFALFVIEDLKLVVAGLNSTIAESHLDQDHFGWLGEQQLRWFERELETYREKEWLRIGAVHHNVVRNAVTDDENLRDADDLKRILGPYLNAVLHGHTHQADMSFWIDQYVPTLSTGSTAVKQEQRPKEVPNQYQILQFHHDRLSRWSRAYVPDQKRWIPDARIAGGPVAGHEEREIAFRSVGGTFPRRMKLRIPECGLRIYLTDPSCGFQPKPDRLYREVADGYELNDLSEKETPRSGKFKHLIVCGSEEKEAVAAILGRAGYDVTGEGCPGIEGGNSWHVWFLLPDYRVEQDFYGTKNNIWG